MAVTEQSSYLFNVEILIEDKHHATALQQLIQQLNNAKFIDYKITSGIELGNIIAEKKENAKVVKSIPVVVEAEKKVSKQAGSSAVNQTKTQGSEIISGFQHGLETFKKFKDQNKLIRLIVNRGLGITLSIPCRIINVDENDQIITVYHVDEKQVYTFRLIEIEDFIES